MVHRRTSGGSNASGSYNLPTYNSNEQKLEAKNDTYDDDSYFSDDQDYSAREPILRAPAERAAFSAMSSHRFRIPNRVMRYLCFALAGSILIFMFSLFRAAVISGQAVQEMKDKEPPPPPWTEFPLLQRYGGGLRTLISQKMNVPEFPRDSDVPLTETKIDQSNLHATPESFEYNPYPDYKSALYVQEFGEVKDCYLDDAETIKPPKSHAFAGVPLGMPEQAYGSYEVLGLNGSICMDRYAKYGPYGYGYSKSRGGSDAGLGGNRDGAEEIWKSQEQIDFTKIDWGKAQKRCSKKNSHRFKQVEKEVMPSWKDMSPRAQEDETPSWMQEFGGENETSAQHKDTTLGAHSISESSSESSSSGPHKIARQAVILRTWSDFEYNEENKMYLRALVNELSLSTGGEFDIHLLVHVKDNDLPIWADEATYQKALKDFLPPEFVGLGTLWSESQMTSIYSGVKDEFDRKDFPPVLGVYRALHLSLQYFSKQHPEYEHIWNFEMDIRYIGNWYEFFTNIGKWASAQPRKGMWERNHRFYIPKIHGPWEDFKHTVRVQSEQPSQENPSRWANLGPDGVKEELEPYIDKPVWGPRWAEGDEGAKPFAEDPVPPTTHEKDNYEWGVGEEADLILFHPLFDPVRTTWHIANDCNGYDRSETGTKGVRPPRRTSIVAAGRLSRRLLDRMHREVALRKHSCFTEMFAPTMALHHGLKAVYAPHPVYIERDWPMPYLAKTFNPGPNGVSGRHKASVFGECCQHNLDGVTWHYNAAFSPKLWKRWWGLKVENVGGEKEESHEGRMCLPPMLFHPIKQFDLP